MGLLPSKPDLSADADADPRVVGVDSEDADDLMSALTSRTARRILSVLHEEPVPPSKLADRVDTSLQNVQYHLERLEDAGAVEVAGTAYSEKGREMDVYAPADEPLVIYAGREEEASGLRTALSRLLSGIFALAIGALAVQEVFGEGIPFPVARTGSGGGADGEDSGGAGGADGADGGSGGDVGIAGDGGGTPEPTPSPDGPEIAQTTPSSTPAPEATGVPTEAATGTSAPTGTPAPVATEAATTTPTAEPTPATAADLATETVRTAAETGGGVDPTGLPPGVLFFLGGALVLVAAVALTYGD
jgi:DNA-binding transcriptional ArsR family regulator